LGLFNTERRYGCSGIEATITASELPCPVLARPFLRALRGLRGSATGVESIQI